MAEQTTDLTGLTQVRSPEELSGLTEEQIVRDPNSDRIFLAAKPSSLKVEPAPVNLDAASGVDTMADELIGGSANQAGILAADNATNQIQQDMARINQLRQQEVSTELNTAKQTEQDALLGLQETKFDALGTEKELRDKLSLQVKEEAFASIQSEIADVKSQLLQDNIAIESKPILGSLIRGQKALAERQAYAKIQGLSMQADVVGGQLDRANNRLSTLMGYMRDSIDTERENYNTVLDLAGRDIINLSNEERSIIDSQMSTLQSQSDMIEQHKDDIRNLQLNNGAAFARAGIDLATDTYDEIVSKMGVATATQDIIDGLVDRYPDAGIMLSDSIQSAEQKIKTNSNIYAQSTRLAGGTGTGTEDTGDGTILSDAGELAAYLVNLGTGLTDEVYKANLNLFAQDWADTGLGQEEMQSILNQEMAKLRGEGDTTGSNFETAQPTTLRKTVEGAGVTEEGLIADYLSGKKVPLGAEIINRASALSENKIKNDIQKIKDFFLGK